PTDARFAGRGFEGGYTIQYVRAVQRFGKASGRAPLATRVNGTVMRAELDRPLPPGQAATLELAYSFEVPEHGSDRLGREQVARTGREQGFTRAAGAGPPLAWRDGVKTVRVVAWAPSPNFGWDARGYAGVLIQSLYPPEATAGWARATGYARHTIKHYSEKWF